MAFGDKTISYAGGAVNDIFAADAHEFGAQGHTLKAEGQEIEAGMYRKAAGLAMDNETFTEQQTAIKLHQTDREAYQTIGGQQAGVAGSGFAASGSALDLLADSTREAAITHSVVSQQGFMTEASYKQQADSYNALAAAADVAAQAEMTAADAEKHAATGAKWAAGISAASSVATLFV